MKAENSGKSRIVVVGGGAGGLGLVARLGKTLGKKGYEITLIEKSRTHIWKPLLHEVAAGSLDANLDEVGYLSHCHRWGYRYYHGALESVDRQSREVVVAPVLDEDGTELIARSRVPYDYLVLAVGGVSNDFGIPGVVDHCIWLDDRQAADRFRDKLFNHCLRVSRGSAKTEGESELVRIAIVGGGATGVELAAELYDSASALRHYGLEGFDENRMQVTLMEAGPRILPRLPEKLAMAAQGELEKLGVRVLPDTMVTEVSETEFITKGGETIPADLMVWAAGVRAPGVVKNIEGLETNRLNQVVVKPTLQSTNDERIFALGDCAACRLGDSDEMVPPRAQAAHQMASTVLDNLRRLDSGKPLKPFIYRDRGSLVSLSRFSTVGSLMGNLVGGSLAIEGRLARMVYVSLYRMHLLAIHGWIKGTALMAAAKFNNIVRPRMKMH